MQLASINSCILDIPNCFHWHC